VFERVLCQGFAAPRLKERERIKEKNGRRRRKKITVLYFNYSKSIYAYIHYFHPS